MGNDEAEMDAAANRARARSPRCFWHSCASWSGRLHKSTRNWESRRTEGVAELEQIADLLAAQGYGPDRIVIDPSVVRGLGYYTGPVYEAELTFEITDEKGRPRQFGSVAGRRALRRPRQALHRAGGAGHRHLHRRRPPARRAPRQGADRRHDRRPRRRHRDGPRPDGRLPGHGLGARAAGIRAEVYLGNPKNFGNQLKYADKRQSPVAVIQGSDEAANGKVQLKDLILGAKLAEDATLEEWKSQPAQTEVDRADLVAGVKALLDRHR
jgi:histidyl-tRNA synthetase